MRLKIKGYEADCANLFEFKTSLGNLGGAPYDAINLYIGNDDRWKSWLLKTKWDDALAGAGILLLRVLEYHQPEDTEQQRLDAVLAFIVEMADGSSPRLTRMASAMAMDVFDLLSNRANAGALTYLSDALIKGAETESGLRTIQAVMAPKLAPEAKDGTCFYTELRKSISRQGDFREWFEAHIPKSMRLKAYQATGYNEALVTASLKQRGKMLEMDLGM